MPFISEDKALAQGWSYCPHSPTKETEAQLWGEAGQGDVNMESGLRSTR